MDTNEIKPIYRAIVNLSEALDVSVSHLLVTLSDNQTITVFKSNLLRSYHAARDEDQKVAYACPTCGHAVDGPTFLAATNESFTA